jgi:hypothetical protein
MRNRSELVPAANSLCAEAGLKDAAHSRDERTPASEEDAID